MRFLLPSLSILYGGCIAFVAFVWSAVGGEVSRRGLRFDVYHGLALAAVIVIPAIVMVLLTVVLHRKQILPRYAPWVVATSLLASMVFSVLHLTWRYDAEVPLVAATLEILIAAGFALYAETTSRFLSLRIAPRMLAFWHFLRLKDYEGPWIDIEQAGPGMVLFSVRQRRLAPARNALLFLAGFLVVMGLSGLWLFAIVRGWTDHHESVAVVPILLILILALPTVVAAGMFAWGLVQMRSPGLVHFWVTGREIILPHPEVEGDYRRLRLDEILGPYATSAPDRAPTIPRPAAVEVVGGGLQGSLTNARSVAEQSFAGIADLSLMTKHFVTQDTGAAVMIEHKAKPVCLARFLTANEANYLVAKLEAVIAELPEPDAG